MTADLPGDLRVGALRRRVRGSTACGWPAVPLLRLAGGAATALDALDGDVAAHRLIALPTDGLTAGLRIPRTAPYWAWAQTFSFRR